MATEKFHFVPSREHEPTRTTRDVELIRANARSHVSRMSHIASHTEQVHKARTPGHRAAVFRWRLDSHSKQHRSGIGRSRQNLQLDIPPMLGDSNGPDPFVRFPDSTSLLDQKLFHFLMIHASRRLYGLQQQSGFDYIRDVTMPKVLLGSEIMSWVTYSAAKMRNTLSLQFSEDWLLERRVQNYQLLRQMIDKHHLQQWDYLISCVASASYIEYSYGQVSEGLMHMKAALKLIKQQREGLRCLQTMELIHANTILTTTCIMGLPMIFDTITPFEDTLPEVMHCLRALQFWNKVSRYDSQNGDAPEQPRNQSWSSEDITKRSLAYSEMHRYWEIRRQSLEVQPLYDYLQTNDLADRPAYDWRSRLITLYLLNSILCNLDRDQAVAKQFLVGLAAMITSSIDPSAPRALHPFIPMIAVCTQRLGIWFYHGPENPLPPIRVWEAILFAEVIMLASCAVRQRVMEAMLQWLYNGPEELHNSALLGETELLMFSVHISESRRRNSIRLTKTRDYKQ